VSACDQLRIWTLAHGRKIVLDRPRIMGILNVTPDSFSDGGRFDRLDHALARAREMIVQGADMLDIGGESTRPGSQRVDADEQIRRVVPVIDAIRSAGIQTPISVDTTLSAVADAAIHAGADAVNDVSGGTEDDAMFGLASRAGAGMVLMHRRVRPEVDWFSHEHPQQPAYVNEGGVVEAVRAFLSDRLEAAQSAGIECACLVTDPGLGFGKDVEQNFQLARSMPRFADLGVPVLSACSRKSFLGVTSGISEPTERVIPTIVMSLFHARVGVRLFRVHDVAAHAQAFAVSAFLA